MTPFEYALSEESRYLANIVDQPMPTDPRSGYRSYIGPTAIIPTDSNHSLITDNERLLLAAWKNQKAWKSA